MRSRGPLLLCREETGLDRDHRPAIPIDQSDSSGRAVLLSRVPDASFAPVNTHHGLLLLMALFTRTPDLIERMRMFGKPLPSSPPGSLSRLMNELRERARTMTESDLLACSFSLGTEAIRRVFGFTLHDVQIRGAAAVASGKVVQMQTGEGKTMVAALAAVNRALSGRGVHVITTNSYLAERDGEELRPVFEMLGISLDVLRQESSLAESRRAYAAEVTYGPGYQFGFDYLKDQLALRTVVEVPLGSQLRAGLNGQRVGEIPLRQRPRDFAIIDEIDSVLLDEASTPLILSGSASGVDDPVPYEIARDSVARFAVDTDFTIESPSQRILLSVDAVTRSQQALTARPRIRLTRPWATYLRNAIQAQHKLLRNEHYAVIRDEVRIVDQNTGRIFADRSWRDGLHQAVQAKERVTITPSETSLARITRQRYFQQYRQLAGLTGTALGAEPEFQSVYALRVVPIATARPCLRRLERQRAFGTLDAKRRAIASDTAQRYHRGQPVLIGTRTIDESRSLSDQFAAIQLPHVVLNGLQDADEASIIAQAGQTGAITIATNMAGRGTDIKLSPSARSAGGLHVVVSEPHISQRIDRQLIGRCSRQGDPGSAQVFVCAEDQLLTQYAPKLAKRLRRLAEEDGECHLDLAQDVLGVQQRIEVEHSQQRAKLLKQDEWLDGVRKVLSGWEAV